MPPGGGGTITLPKGGDCVEDAGVGSGVGFIEGGVSGGMMSESKALSKCWASGGVPWAESLAEVGVGEDALCPYMWRLAARSTGAGLASASVVEASAGRAACWSSGDDMGQLRGGPGSVSRAYT